jgi:hypothetical protein
LEITAETDVDPSLLSEDRTPPVKTEVRAVAVEWFTSSWESVKLDTGSSEWTEITDLNSDWAESESGNSHHIDVGTWKDARAEGQNEPETNDGRRCVAISCDVSGQIVPELPVV